jgi:outer membrane protein TolC
VAGPNQVLPREVSPLSKTVTSALLVARIFLQPVHAETGEFALPEPLTVEEAVQFARDHRSEIVAAHASAAAASERPAIVSSLEDPMLMPSVDHYPFRGMDGMSGERIYGQFNWSATVEQRFPLSRQRSHRRRGAEAEARRISAEYDRAVLDVELEAVDAFLMLRERRRMLEVVGRQVALAEQMVQAANARFAAAAGGQGDVLRAEVEVARLQARQRALRAEERGMQAMFNASIGREIEAQVADLAAPVYPATLLSTAEAASRARLSRPELRAGTAEIARAESEVEVMQSMYRPMAFVRLGPASTMDEGRGAMVMVGVSLPIWRGKLRAGVAEARAMEQMARADLFAMQRMVESDAINARQSVAAARETYLALRDDVIPRARMALEPALAGFSAGTNNVATVIDAAQAQWSAEAELVMAETDLGVAWARLERAMGRFEDNQP